MNGAIRVSQLGKAYKHYPRHWARLAEWLWPARGPRHQLKWVLREVSFEVAPGEALGIVGLNGAGKSTLLKLITGTTRPTSGSVHLSGRVAALLELGMGFHPDFSGRHNARMAAQLLGLGGAEIDALMPQIAAFAELGDYLDRPVRVYSSGMQMRLAFSVATARRPDVLIVDEALSVGDAYFQHKSFERIRAFRRHGTTLLIVSHDRGAIQSVCDRALLLDGGRVARQGSPDEVMDFYNARLAEPDAARVRTGAAPDGRTQTVSGDGRAAVVAIALEDARGAPLALVNVGAAVTLRVRVRAGADLPQLVLGYLIKDRLGQDVYGTNTHHSGQTLRAVRAGEEIEFRFRFPLNLGPGSYSVSTGLHSDHSHLSDNYEWRDLALLFEVLNMNRTEFVGNNWLEPAIEIVR